jgi:hypothetical protein
MGVDIKSTKGRVEELIKHNPHLRDSVDKVIANIWHEDITRITKKKPADVSAIRMLSMYAEGELTNAESIRRSWQLLLKNNEHYRGPGYAKRHGKTKQVKEDLGYKVEK